MSGSLPAFKTQLPNQGKEKKKEAAITVASWLSELCANLRLASGGPQRNDDSLT